LSRARWFWAVFVVGVEVMVVVGAGEVTDLSDQPERGQRADPSKPQPPL
jgi:hypothetical protein